MTSAMMLLPLRFWSPVAALHAAQGGAAGKSISALIQTIQTAAQERARYRQVRDEIARMPADMALDLGICRGDAEELAQRALPGR